ncbi:MAG: hypothetical protein EA378_11375 [Phycisphaerales bacterium]|nr:MAG: hypothetical protein EA378_11375 [Phycisphaerales bacterium]
MAAIVAVAGGAQAASITNVVTMNGAGSEPGVGQIYSALTGISLANNAVNQVGAGSGSVGIGTNTIAGRVSDDLDGVWFDGTIDVGFAALYWGNANQAQGSANHSFGVTQDNGAVSTLFNAGPSHATTLGDVFTGLGPFPTTSELRFVAQNAASGVTANSDADNNAGRDRMITFDITGLETLNVSAFGGIDIDLTALPALGEGKGTFLLFFETGSDNDFQDLVVLAHNVGFGRNVPIIPLPSAAGLGFLGLAGLAARRRR